MTTTLYTSLSKLDWHALRTECITSTEVAALFDLSPYETRFELWHRKKDGVVGEVFENERMKWGNRLQFAIAEGIVEDQGWNKPDLQSAEGMFWVDRDLRIGASADYLIDTGEDCLLEIKNVDSLAFKQGWVANDDGTVEAPPHIELQVQHQMLVTGYKKVYIGALVGGNSVTLLERKADEAIHSQILTRCAEFWKSIATETPPPFDPVKDYDAVLASAGGWSNNVLRADDLTEEAQLVAKLAAAQLAAKQADDAVTALKTQIAAKMGDCGKLQTNFGTCSINIVTPSAGTLVTPEMVGTYIGARKGSKQFRFYPKGGK